MTKAESLASESTTWDSSIMTQKQKERRAAAVEKRLDKDMEDLKAHIKCVTDETNGLRDRVRAAEAVISELKSSGESSVEQLMETLYMMKVRQAELDNESARMRDIISKQESQLKQKEDYKASIK